MPAIELLVKRLQARDGLSAAEFDSGVYKQGGEPVGTFPAHVEIVAPGLDADALLREA